MKDDSGLPSISAPSHHLTTSHRRHHSRTVSQSLSSLSRQQSPAIDLVPAPVSTGTITVTSTIITEAPRKTREYINVAQRKELRKHGAIQDASSMSHMEADWQQKSMTWKDWFTRRVSHKNTTIAALP
ncbi:hypothetical protein BGW38_006502 [Lunasporangiospora selenospora]|uniref:Uncharacterized protein n=1 Tax=Lunasporangiospora selenospora TaxID=979761 RepID=A0A9P6FMK3_9FUNG|nr:hypothetical protein BGW38_006502 [Lunasporangiospora selenospora]